MYIKKIKKLKLSLIMLLLVKVNAGKLYVFNKIDKCIYGTLKKFDKRTDTVYYTNPLTHKFDWVFYIDIEFIKRMKEIPICKLDL
jgi:hypothetical protein